MGDLASAVSVRMAASCFIGRDEMRQRFSGMAMLQGAGVERRPHDGEETARWRGARMVEQGPHDGEETARYSGDRTMERSPHGGVLTDTGTASRRKSGVFKL